MIFWKLWVRLTKNKYSAESKFCWRVNSVDDNVNDDVNDNVGSNVDDIVGFRINKLEWRVAWDKLAPIIFALL